METHNPKTFTAAKLYWYVLAPCTILMAVLALLAYWALGSGNDAGQRIVNYYSFYNKLFYLNLFSYIVLLALAGYLHRRRGKRLYYLPAATVFVAFANISFGVLAPKLFLLRQEADMATTNTDASMLFAIALSIIGVLMALLVFVGIYLAARK